MDNIGIKMGDIGIKICGLNDAASVHASCAYGADYLGFVFYPRSPRHIDISTASELVKIARGEYGGSLNIKIVALTVDMDDAGLSGIIEGLHPDFIQMHGHESPLRVQSVIMRFGISVIKAISVSQAGDIGRMGAYLEDIPPDFAVIPMFDAPPPDADGLPGGNGRIFDWDLLSDCDFSHFFLSGGLNSANVISAICHTHSPCVDVSSGVEDRIGVKSPLKIKSFISAVRSYGTEERTNNG